MMLNPDIYSRRVEEIMSEPDLTIEPTDPISEALGRMKKYDAQEIPVVERGKLKGLLTFRTLARRRKIPITAQVKSFMITPPKIKSNDSLPVIVEKLINRDFTSLPVTFRGSLKGIVSRKDIIESMRDDPNLKKIPVEAIMNFAPTTFHADLGIRKAMNMMDLSRETYVAIIDDAGNFLGVVTHSDILTFLEQPPDKPHTGDFHGEKVHRDISISSLAGMVETLPRGSNLFQVVNLMMKLNVPMVYIMDGEKLAGSVGEVDILEIILRDQPKIGPLIQIAGIEDAKLMDAGDLNTIISRYISRIEKLTQVSAVTVRIRHHHHETDDDKYTVNVKMTTSQSVYSREAYDWGLEDAMGTAFNNIEKSLKKDIEKRRGR